MICHWVEFSLDWLIWGGKGGGERGGELEAKEKKKKEEEEKGEEKKEEKEEEEGEEKEWRGKTNIGSGKKTIEPTFFLLRSVTR